MKMGRKDAPIGAVDALGRRVEGRTIHGIVRAMVWNRPNKKTKGRGRP